MDVVGEGVESFDNFAYAQENIFYILHYPCFTLLKTNRMDAKILKIGLFLHLLFFSSSLFAQQPIVCKLGDSEKRKARLVEASKKYQAALTNPQLDSNKRLNYYISLAAIHGQLRDFSKAISYLDTVLMADKNHLDARFRRGELLVRSNYYQEDLDVEQAKQLIKKVHLDWSYIPIYYHDYQRKIKHYKEHLDAKYID